MTADWRYDYLDPANARFFSNPRTEMAPEDYAPTRDWRDEAHLDIEPAYDSDTDGDDDE